MQNSNSIRKNKQSQGKFQEITKKFPLWVQKKYFQLAILNLFIMTLILLKSADYFLPYFPITINVIVVSGILATIILLKVRSNFSFVAALVFWFFTAIFRIFYVLPWAERTALYSFEAFAIGTIHLIIETILAKNKNVQ